MEDINKTIGKNLLTLRKMAKLTQLELAEKFNYSDKSISKWEAGESLPSVEILYNLCNFYGVTLDNLTQEEMIIEPKRKSITSKFIPNLPVRLIITLLAVSAVWLLATILFVSFKISLNINIGMFFMWAVPLSCIILIIFNSIWGRSTLLLYILSLLIWSTLACVHVQLLKYNLWMVYLLGIPLQVAIILWACLLKKRNQPKPKKIKEIKPKKEKHKKEKKAKIKDKDKNNLNVKPDFNSNLKTETDLNLNKTEDEVANLNLKTENPDKKLDIKTNLNKNAKTNIKNNLNSQAEKDNAQTSPAKKSKKKGKTSANDDFGFDFIQHK